MCSGLLVKGYTSGPWLGCTGLRTIHLAVMPNDSQYLPHRKLISLFIWNEQSPLSWSIFYQEQDVLLIQARDFLPDDWLWVKLWQIGSFLLLIVVLWIGAKSNQSLKYLWYVIHDLCFWMMVSVFVQGSQLACDVGILNYFKELNGSCFVMLISTILDPWPLTSEHSGGPVQQQQQPRVDQLPILAVHSLLQLLTADE